ncbi:tetratricopeptide repeat protein [Desulfonatronum parangueonense]
MAKSTKKTNLEQDSKAALDSILNPEAKARLQREVSLSQPVKGSSERSDVLEFPAAKDDQGSLQTSKKGKKETVSKQKTKKAPSSSKLTKPELENLTVEFREEIETIGQEQKKLQQSTAEEFEQLRSSLQRLKQSLSAGDVRADSDQEKLREVAEMTATQQQRMDRLQEVLDERPWLKLYEELQGAVQESRDKVAAMEKFVQTESTDLKKMLQDIIQKVSDLESQAASQPAEPVDLSQDLNSVKQRLSELENEVKDAKAALSAPAHEPTQKSAQEPAQKPTPEPAQAEPTQIVQEPNQEPTAPPAPAPAPPSAAAESVPAGSSVVMVAQPTEAVDETQAEEWLRRARLLWNGQRFTNAAAAVDLLTKALDADPANAEMFNERGLAQLDAGFPDKALSDFSRAIMLDAKLASAFHNRGLLYMKMDNRDLACRDFRSAATLGDSRALKMAQETGYCGSSVLKKLFRGIID